MFLADLDMVGEDLRAVRRSSFGILVTAIDAG